MPRKKQPPKGKALQPLNARELRFVEQILICDSNTEAASNAGYSKRSAHVTATRLLKKANVAAAIEKARSARSLRTGITQDRVLCELEHLAFSRIDHYLVTDAGQVVLAAGAPEQAIAAVASLKHKKTTKEVGEMVITEHEVEIKLWDKPGTLKLAGRHIGLFPDRLEVTGKGGKPLQVEAVRAMSDEELLGRAKELLGKL